MSEMLNPPVNIELDWSTLIESIKRGNCILLLGPQVSFKPDDLDFLPLTTRLAHDLAKIGKFADDKELVFPDDIAHVTQLFQQKHYRLKLEIAVKKFYDDYQNLTTQFHLDMAFLPFTLCINTTPDKFFINALEKTDQINALEKTDPKHKEPIWDYYNFKRARSFASIQPTVDKPYIFNLYGHCDDLESLVITEDDLLEFLVNVIKGSPELPPFIRSQFANKDLNFLFVGFGFHSWHNRILLHALNAHNHENQSLAVEDRSFFDHPDCCKTAVFYTRHNKIKFEQLSWLEFARQLRDTYTQTTTSKISQPKRPPENAPKVFLCYASEDREQVEQLNRQLQTEGIEPWQDNQKLRAGDNWNLQLVKVIQEFVDYVIVVQTPNMTTQIEGYFHKEIATALDRQKSFAYGVRFILPIMLSDCKLLAQFDDAKLHNIHLDVTGGFEQLVDAIKSDWQQRQKGGAA
jgi:hypothetical protein